MLFVRHASRPPLGHVPHSARDDVPITPNGQAAAERFGQGLALVNAIVTSPVRRCVQTAEAIADAAWLPRQFVFPYDRLRDFRGESTAGYNILKQELGWGG